MDEGIDEESIVNLIKFMINNDINNSRDMDEEMWNSFVEKYGNNDIKDLMETADDMIYIPELMEFIEKYDNIVLLGGGVNECLKEVEIALLALDKPYTVYNKFTY